MVKIITFVILIANRLACDRSRTLQDVAALNFSILMEKKKTLQYNFISCYLIMFYVNLIIVLMRLLVYVYFDMFFFLVIF